MKLVQIAVGLWLPPERVRSIWRNHKAEPPHVEITVEDHTGHTQNWTTTAKTAEEVARIVNDALTDSPFAGTPE